MLLESLHSSCSCIKLLTAECNLGRGVRRYTTLIGKESRRSTILYSKRLAWL